jgi:tetratricopeptide (TPR) repeat protein
MLCICVFLIASAAQANEKKDLKKQAQAAEQAGDPVAAQVAYCALAEEDKKNDSARAKCAEYTRRNGESRKRDADQIAAGEKALTQNHLDEATQDFKAVVGNQYRDTVSHYLNVVIPQARLKLQAEQEKLAAEAKNNDLLQQGVAAYQHNDFEKAKPLLAAVTGDNAAKAQKNLRQIDEYTKAENEGLRLDSAGRYEEAIESYNRALKIKSNGPGGLKQKIASATEKMGPVKQTADQPLIDGIADFYNGNYQQAGEKLSAFSGSGSRKALALFYLGASELTRYFLAGADDKSKNLYNQAVEHFRAARQAAAGFKPPQPYVSPRILAVFSQSGS